MDEELRRVGRTASLKGYFTEVERGRLERLEERAGIVEYFIESGGHTDLPDMQELWLRIVPKSEVRRRAELIRQADEVTTSIRREFSSRGFYDEYWEGYDMIVAWETNPLYDEAAEILNKAPLVRYLVKRNVVYMPGDFLETLPPDAVESPLTIYLNLKET